MELDAGPGRMLLDDPHHLIPINSIVLRHCRREGLKDLRRVGQRHRQDRLERRARVLDRLRLQAFRLSVLEGELLWSCHDVRCLP